MLEGTAALQGGFENPKERADRAPAKFNNTDVTSCSLLRATPWNGEGQSQTGQAAALQERIRVILVNMEMSQSAVQPHSNEGHSQSGCKRESTTSRSREVITGPLCHSGFSQHDIQSLVSALLPPV